MDYYRDKWLGLEGIKVIQIFIPRVKSVDISYLNNSLRIDTREGELLLYKHSLDKKWLHTLESNTLFLDNTYVEDLANPTVEELDYLEILFGSDLIDIYRYNLEVLKEDLC